MCVLPFVALVLLAATGNAAPSLADKPPRWEYAELTYRTLPGRPAGTDADGNAIAAVPASMAIHWISPTGELDAKGWVELSEKLKALGFKKDGSAAFLKIQFLNFLGSEGWELMQQSGGSPATLTGPGARGDRGGGGFSRASSTSTWMLKRRVP